MRTETISRLVGLLVLLGVLVVAAARPVHAVAAIALTGCPQNPCPTGQFCCLVRPGIGICISNDQICPI